MKKKIFLSLITLSGLILSSCYSPSDSTGNQSINSSSSTGSSSSISSSISSDSSISSSDSPVSSDSSSSSSSISSSSSSSSSSSFEDIDVDNQHEAVRFVYQGQEVKSEVYSLNTILSLKDAPFTLSSDRTKYIQWSILDSNGEKHLLNDHILLDEGGKTLQINGEEASYENSMEGEINRKLTENGEVIGEALTSNDQWKDVLTEDLDLGNEYIGTPDNLVTLSGYGYDQDLACQIKAVRGKINDGIISGSYYDTVAVNQNLNQEYATGNQVHVMLDEDGNFFGESENGEGKKPISYNGDTTIGLERPLSDNVPATGDSASYKPTQTTFDTVIDPNDSKNGTTNYCVTRITLTHDVVWTGKLELGGITGFYGQNEDHSQYNMQGFIIGSYTELDLNGYDLVFADNDNDPDNGYGSTDYSGLNSYGSITDSSENKTGNLIMGDGTYLYTPFVIEDYDHPEAIANIFNAGMTPFTSYRTPYLNANTTFNPRSKFFWHFKFDTAGNSNTGVINTDIYALGNSFTNNSTAYIPLIEVSAKDEDAKITRKVTYDQIPDMTDYESANIVNQHFNYDIYDADLKFHSLSLQMKVSLFSVTMDLDRTPFFIPHYYSFNLHSSDLTLNNTLVFLPGSYLTSDSQSNVILTKGEMKHFDGFSFMVSIQACDFQGVGGLVFMDQLPVGTNNLFTFTYWDYIKNTTHSQLWYNQHPSYFDCDGSIAFDSQSDIKEQIRPYQLGGHIDFANLEQFENSLEEFKAQSSDKVQLYGDIAYGLPCANQLSLIKHTATSVNAFLNIPLISDERVLTDMEDTSKVSSEKQSWDVANRLVNKEDGSYYGFFLTDAQSNSDNINNSGYLATSTENKPDSLTGSYQEVEAYNDNPAIVSLDDIYYINFRGIFIPMANQETISTDLASNGDYLSITNNAFPSAFNCFFGSDAIHQSSVKTFTNNQALDSTGDKTTWRVN